MNMKHKAGLVFVAVTLVTGPALAQESRPASAPAPGTLPAAPETKEAPRWSFAGTLYSYSPDNDSSYLQPTITADRDWLHLEARYNYEARDTASVWVGYNLNGGSDLAWQLTPMLGGVFGHTQGVAPGYKGSLSWRKLSLYSEGEYLIDTEQTSDSFFYNWSELTLAPADWIRFGVVTQRTRAYAADRDIQRGLLLGLSLKRLTFTAHVFDLDTHDPTYVFSFGLGL
jgi:hypothetical protein